MLVLVFSGYLYVTGPDSQGAMERIFTSGRLLLHKYALLKHITSVEERFLYISSCSRKCHSKGVVEDQPRTSREWDVLVARMTERAGLSEPQAKTITAHLQRNYLSQYPTMISGELMRFLKSHLWRFEFGDNDLYLDVIYVPELHSRMLPYLGAGGKVKKTRLRENTAFILLMNTHQGVIPSWDLAGMATLKFGELQVKAQQWEEIYEDGQRHHKEGALYFPSMDEGWEGVMEMVIDMPGLKKKVFQWKLPVPPFKGRYEKQLNKKMD